MRKIVITIVTALIGVGAIIVGVIAYGRYTHSCEE